MSQRVQNTRSDTIIEPMNATPAMKETKSSDEGGRGDGSRGPPPPLPPATSASNIVFEEYITIVREHAYVHVTMYSGRCGTRELTSERLRTRDGSRLRMKGGGRKTVNGRDILRSMCPRQVYTKYVHGRCICGLRLADAPSSSFDMYD